jgi:hypothetical protein
MVQFSTHEYCFDLKDGEKWVERLVYFYGKDFKVENVCFPSDFHPKAQITMSGIKMGDLFSVIPKMKNVTGEMKVHLGRRWVGSAQSAVLSVLPSNFTDDVKANVKIEERLKSDDVFKKDADDIWAAWQSIINCYENGYEVYVNKTFPKPIDLPTLHDLPKSKKHTLIKTPKRITF